MTKPVVKVEIEGEGKFSLVLNRSAFPGHQHLFGGGEQIRFLYSGEGDSLTRDFRDARTIALAMESMANAYVGYKKHFGDLESAKKNFVRVTPAKQPTTEVDNEHF